MPVWVSPTWPTLCKLFQSHGLGLDLGGKLFILKGRACKVLI
jgi:hypothetical protein